MNKDINPLAELISLSFLRQKESGTHLSCVLPVPGPYLVRIKVPIYGEDTDRVRTGTLFETFSKRSLINA